MRHSAPLYLHGDLELVQRADVLHQHRDDELMGDALQNTQPRRHVRACR